MRRLLVTRGIMDEDGTGRRARRQRCRTCRAVVIRGYDDDRVAGVAVVDPTPLDRHGELAALLCGRATFDLRIGLGRTELDYRESWTIAGPMRYPVLPAHACHLPIAIPDPAIAAPPVPVRADHAEPEF
jgi:hypothetical protein